MAKKIIAVVCVLFLGFAAFVTLPFVGLFALILGFGGHSNQAACINNAPVALSPAAVHITTTGVTIDGFPLSAEQSKDAAIIVGVAKSRSLTARDALIGLMVGIQESRLYNLNYGDRDSGGVFQQRPSQGWGTFAQVRDPVYATNAFYDALVKVPGHETMPLIDAAEAVQRPSKVAYAKSFMSWEPAALYLLGKDYTPDDPSITAQSVAQDNGCSVGGNTPSAVEAMIQAILSQVGTPYRWGVETPTTGQTKGGFDCSALMQWGARQAGIKLPRTSREQWTVGQHVGKNQLQRGDLVFWATNLFDPGSIHHVAMYLGKGQIVAAPHTGALVQVEPMYYSGFIGGTRLTSIAPKAKQQANTATWQLPLTSGSYQLGPDFGALGNGVDFIAPKGTTAHDAATGIVTATGYTKASGNFVSIQSTALDPTDKQIIVVVQYSHMTQLPALKVGQTVARGQIIGHVGSSGIGTGYRLLFGVMRGGQYVDPLQFLREQGLRP